MQSLRTLRLSTYPNLDGFNIPSIIDNLFNLRQLWIDAAVEPKLYDLAIAGDGAGVSPASPGPTKKTVSETDLAREMSGVGLPLKLNAITLSGTGFIRIADQIFRVNVFDKIIYVLTIIVICL